MPRSGHAKVWLCQGLVMPRSGAPRPCQRGLRHLAVTAVPRSFGGYRGTSLMFGGFRGTSLMFGGFRGTSLTSEVPLQFLISSLTSN